MNNKTKCPICKKKKFKKFFQSKISLTSDRNLVKKNSDVGYCYKCKVILNSTGCRNQKKFYYDEYNLLGKKANEEFRIYSEKNSGSESEIMANYFFENYKKPHEGKLLEVGAGKGLFLKHINKLLPKMDLYGLEPSKNAAHYFKKNLPKVKFDQNSLELSKFRKMKFDVIVSTGVIEHVNNPDEFLKITCKLLKPNGTMFLCLPNFESKVDDLILYDHLSKLTKYSLNLMFDKHNLKLIKQNISKKRVWIWNVLKKVNNKIKLKRNNNDIKILKQHVLNFNKMDNAYLRYTDKKKDLTFYGIGNSGFYFYFKYLNKFKNKIKYILLDNDSLRNSYLFGAKIISRKDIKKYNINSIYISANPCYHSLMRKKLKDINFQGKIYN